MPQTHIVLVQSRYDDVNSFEFFRRVHAAPEINKDFVVARLDATAIRDVLRDEITKNGISSLFHYDITCDAVMHPGIHVDDIEKLILGFLSTLQGVKNLFVIDPYFYTSEPPVLALFEKMMKEVAATLESVTFFTAKSRSKAKSDPTAMHAVLKKVIPAIKIKDVKTDDFHDRFWIDPDRKKGLVMGTSLNGVTNKIALIDHLRDADAAQLVTLAQALV